MGGEEGLCLVGCHVVAETQGYHLVCIWGSLVKFQGGGVVLKTVLCARIVDLLISCTGAYRYRSKLSVSLKLRRFVSSWVSCCCTDTGLSSGMHLG